MAPNFTPFTGFSYASGLAALGQGLNRLSDGFEKAEDRRLLAALGTNPTAAAAFAAGQPALGLGLLKQEQERRDQQRTQEADRRALGFEGLGGGSAGTGSTTSAPAASSGGGAGPYAGAISNIESGGRYDILGPVTKTGDRAYGKYQVMGANIPAWTREILGQEMTPEQFRNNPAAQDAVFKGKFGQYAQKYGPEGAARAWFAGEGGMNDLNRRDQLGTTVGSYGRRFMAGYGGQGGAPADVPAPAQPVRVASAAPMAPAPQGGTPPTPEEIRAGQAAGIFPPDAVPEFIAQQYQREPVYRQMVDQWRAQRGGQPTQVAAAGPQDAAAADAARVQAQGGPRMVLSPQNPLTNGGAPAGPQQVASADIPLPPAAPPDIRPQIAAQPGPTQLGMQPPAQPPAPPAMPGSPQQIASVAAALRPQAPQQPAPSPSQVAGARPADMPAPGAQPVQQEPRFTIPGTNETVPASASQRLLTLRQQLSVPNISTELRQRLMTDYRDEIGNLRTLAKEEREAARRDAEGPTDLTKEFVWARRNKLTEAKTPAEYAREKAKATEPKDPTEGQANANIYARRMEEAEQVLSAPGIAAASVDPRNRAADMVPFVGNFMVSSDYQRATQAQRDFINASLRRESGAAISSSEFENARRQYFPQPGDGPDVLAQKARNRMTQIEGIRAAAGRAYTREAPSQRPVSSVEQRPQQPGAPSRADLEAEARRRGLIR